MKHLLNFIDLTEDYSLYLESEDFELANGINESQYGFEDFTQVDMEDVKELYDEGLSHEQIAIEMDFSLGKVKQIISSLRKNQSFDQEEYDPYSYEGCGCCPVCTGERDCECGCPECDCPDEFEKLEESKKSGVTASLKKKSKASGIPMGILRKVFAKGMQAWNAGHRPGVAQHQWGMGRVNSFITGAGGARKADATLWAKARKAKARKRKKRK
jgi:hypothetical protein